jgi:hypothetical protein
MRQSHENTRVTRDIKVLTPYNVIFSKSNSGYNDKNQIFKNT